MKIAILGGRFDPIHVGHILIARQVLELRPGIDKVLFIPALQHLFLICQLGRFFLDQMKAIYHVAYEGIIFFSCNYF